MINSGYGVVLVTVPNQTEGRAIAKQLIEAKLAACVNLLPIDSIYLWQGQIESDQEYQLIIKTDLNQFGQLADKIKTLHSYEVPEIIALPIVAGSRSYLDWLSKSLQN
ncbi:MAG: divalent-cation tolerance protein CutA [Cyanobacteria bacterium J06600_6]